MIRFAIYDLCLLRIKPVLLIGVVAVCLMSCSDDPDFQDPVDFVLEGMIDGRPILLDEEASFRNTTDATLQRGDSNKLYYGQEMIFIHLDASQYFNIRIEQFFTASPNGSVSDRDRNAMFVVGPYDYVKQRGDFGVVVEYRTSDGKLWRSNGGPQHQSHFELVRKSGQISQLNSTYLEVEGRFNCTLYDADSNAISLTDMRLVSEGGSWVF